MITMTPLHFLTFLVFIRVISLFPVMVIGVSVTITDPKINSIDLSMALGRGYHDETTTLRSTCLQIDNVTHVDYNLNQPPQVSCK